LPQALTVLVTDPYGNPVPGVNVDFDDGGAGGSYAYTNPGITSSSGTVTQFYTLPPSPKTITITATATGVASPAVFTETGQ
jgi:protocatechuate 3,4-dioxygenase beta subunit